MSSRKIIVKRLPTLNSTDNTFRVIKVTGPRTSDVDLIGTTMTKDELKKFIGSTDSRQTAIEIVE